MVAVLFTGATAALGIWLMAAFQTGEAAYQFEVNRSWVSDFGISWHVGIDGISLFLVVLTVVLFPIALLGATPHHDAKPYYAWLLLLEAGCIGVFVSLDLFMFFVMFEVVLVPMYFLIGGWGYANRVYAALKFFLFTMFGSALMLVGIVATAYLHRDAVEEQNRAEAQEIVADAQGEPSGADAERVAQLEEGEPLNFDLVEIAEDRNVVDDSTGADPWDWSAARWIFLAFAIAFAVKVPLFPLHTWLPDAHTEAPTAGSVILAGVMLKLGTYGLVRFGLYLFPDAANFFAPGHGDPGRDRHHLRRRRRHDAEGPQTARRLLVGGAPRVHRARHLRHHHPGPPGRRCCRTSTTACRPARCSCWSA